MVGVFVASLVETPFIVGVAVVLVVVVVVPVQGLPVVVLNKFPAAHPVPVTAGFLAGVFFFVTLVLTGICGSVVLENQVSGFHQDAKETEGMINNSKSKTIIYFFISLLYQNIKNYIAISFNILKHTKDSCKIRFKKALISS